MKSTSMKNLKPTNRILKCATKKARRLIDKKKYYGVKTNIKEYQNEIFNTFYDETLLKQTIGTEALTLVNYFQDISLKINELLEKAKEILLDSFQKGSKRLLDKNGNAIKFDEIKDSRAIDFLVNQQTDYYKGITEAQSRKANKLIALGLEKGESFEETAKKINSSIKGLTKARSLNIARTEIVKSHTVGQIQTMKEAGVEHYNYITANDSKVSKICRKNQGPKGRERIYNVALAGTEQNPLPVINSHPSCRCVIVVR